MEAGFEVIFSFNVSAQVYEIGLDSKGRACLNRTMASGEAIVHTDWQGNAHDLSAACQKALEGSIGQPSWTKLALFGCTQLINSNDDEMTGRTPERELVTCEFQLPVDMIQSLLDKLGA